MAFSVELAVLRLQLVNQRRPLTMNQLELWERSQSTSHPIWQQLPANVKAVVVNKITRLMTRTIRPPTVDHKNTEEHNDDREF